LHSSAVSTDDLSFTPSEMAERFRAMDWSTTPLGPVERWPQSLRIAVGICLNSRFPMFVWWGPQLVNIYNDAYAPVLGQRHPAAFAMPARKIWDEIWPVVGPQAESVMETGEATWNERVLLVMERHGYPENTYFTWSYSAIPDGSGGIGGVFCACTEETPRVLAEAERDRLLKRVEGERARLAEAFAQSPAFVAVLSGRDMVFEYVNERYLQLIGRRDVMGKPARKAVPEVAGQGFFEILDHVYDSGEPFVGTAMRVQLKRGAALEDAYVDFVYQPMRGPDGTVTGILAHGIEVTEAKRAEARDHFMLELEDAVRPLDEPSAITATCAQLLGEYLKADRCAYADVEDDEDTFNLMGDYNRGVPSIVGRYRFADFGDEVLRLMRSNKPFVVADVDHHVPPIEDPSSYRQTHIQAVICVPLHKAGRFAAAMAVHQTTPRSWQPDEIALVQHVASRCWESIERSRVHRTLRESEANFRQLADAMPQIVFSAQPDGHVDYFNRQWYEYTGMPEGEIGYESWKQVHRPDGLARVAQRWSESLRTGNSYEIEYELRRYDGEFRWHLGRALPVRDERGRIVRWFGTNTDIHERKQFEQSLQQARADAERASRMKDEFLATLSHELRTPLNAILGWSQILKMRPELPPDEIARGIAVIERNARAQGRIIEDLLDMSAILSGKVRLDVQRIDLAEIVQAAVETIRPAADAKQIRLQSILDPLVGVTVSGDASRLQQVLWNLLSNAVKFTPKEGRVQVVLERVNSHVEICVIDTGEGIAAEFLPYIFDRFRQADASTTRRHGGLGLGLSIVKQLVELHGGSMRVKSGGPGQGSTFIVSLPINAVRAEASAGDPPRRANPSEADTRVPDECGAIAGLSVLVVDDDEDARELVCQLLTDCDAVVETAGSAKQALQKLRQRRFHVLVSDIGMPEEDGYALIRSVRALGASAGGQIPAIALTAYARAEDRVKAVRAGFQMHLAKPIEPAELIAMVASLARRV
jgi:PAS domain S-box-containing protein